MDASSFSGLPCKQKLEAWKQGQVGYTQSRTQTSLFFLEWGLGLRLGYTLRTAKQANNQSRSQAFLPPVCDRLQYCNNFFLAIIFSLIKNWTRIVHTRSNVILRHATIIEFIGWAIRWPPIILFIVNLHHVCTSLVRCQYNYNSIHGFTREPEAASIDPKKILLQKKGFSQPLSEVPRNSYCLPGTLGV